MYHPLPHWQNQFHKMFLNSLVPSLPDLFTTQIRETGDEAISEYKRGYKLGENKNFPCEIFSNMMTINISCRCRVRRSKE